MLRSLLSTLSNGYHKQLRDIDVDMGLPKECKSGRAMREGWRDVQTHSHIQIVEIAWRCGAGAVVASEPNSRVPRGAWFTK
jgi:hypothetical protein